MGLADRSCQVQVYKGQSQRKGYSAAEAHRISGLEFTLQHALILLPLWLSNEKWVCYRKN